MLPDFQPPSGIRVVYTDMDGTMLGRNGAFVVDPDGVPTAEPAAALVAAHHAGVEVVPCSGRTIQGLVRDARILGMSTAIGEMGAVLSYDFGRSTVQNLGEYPGGDQPPTHAMEREGALALVVKSFSLEPHTPWAAGRDYSHLLRGRADVDDVDAALERAGFGWVRLADNGVLHGTYLGLEPGQAHAYHLLPRGISKATAIARDRAERSIPKGECIAIGDSWADLAMAAEVATLVLTADAVAGDASLARSAAAAGNVTVAPRNGNLGWADALAAVVARH